MRGDKVVDNSRIIEKEGIIQGMLMNFIDPLNEVIEKVYVRFNKTDVGVVEYGPEKFTTFDGEKWVID